jgi:hypothetical protein
VPNIPFNCNVDPRDPIKVPILDSAVHGGGDDGGVGGSTLTNPFMAVERNRKLAPVDGMELLRKIWDRTTERKETCSCGNGYAWLRWRIRRARRSDTGSGVGRIMLAEDRWVMSQATMRESDE